MLFLDDDVELRRLVGTVLRYRGYEVVVAQELEEAGALLACGSFDVLCTDLSLDGLDRFEVLELLSEARAASEKLRIVVLTGSDDPGVHAACRAHGADFVLVKQASLAPLLDIVDSWIGGRLCKAG